MELLCVFNECPSFEVRLETHHETRHVIPLLLQRDGRSQSEMSVPRQEGQIAAFHGGQDLASESVRTGWAALRAVLRSWGIQSPEQLSEWLRSRRFLATRTPHFGQGARILLHEGCTEDALLETVFVPITLHLGRTSGVPPPTSTRLRGAVHVQYPPRHPQVRGNR